MQFASDSSIIIHRDRPLDSFGSLAAHSQSLGLLNLRPGYKTVLIDFDPLCTDPAELKRKLGRLLDQPVRKSKTPNSKLITVPVKYGGAEGPDLADMAEAAGLSVDEVIRLHGAADYEVAFVGFTPGFPYLNGLPRALAMPRKSIPRIQVPSGSVGIAGTQTGIYPGDSPGGWQIIGRTDLELFSPEREVPTLFAPGDHVRFRSVDALSPRVGQKTTPDIQEVGGIEILDGGFQMTVQDLGRPGFAHLGVPVAGAADPFALRMGNAILGNRANAAAVEVTLGGGTFKFLNDTWVAVAGAEAPLIIAGKEIEMWNSVPVHAGQVLIIGPAKGQLRTYLCVRGGVQVPMVMNSRSTHVTGGWGGLGGRKLKSHDILCLGDETRMSVSHRPNARLPRAIYSEESLELRATRGLQWDWFSPESQRTIFADQYEVSAESNRMGLRLIGPTLLVDEAHANQELESEGVPEGAVQVSSGGQPMVLYCEAGTTGGYPKIANVIRADLFRLGQLRPGVRFRFKEVSLEQAWSLNWDFQNTLRNAGYGY